MKSTVGRPRSLTDAQLARVLQWHGKLQHWKELRKQFETAQDLAREMGTTLNTIYRAAACAGHYKVAAESERATWVSRRRARLKEIQQADLD